MAFFSDFSMVTVSTTAPPSCLGLGGRSAKGAASRAHGTAKLLPLFGRHLLPAFHHPPAPSPATMRTSAESAEKDLAENQKPQGLPVGDNVPTKQSWREPVPKTHDHIGKDCQEQQRE